MKLAQAMDDCSGPNYSIWFCRLDMDRLCVQHVPSIHGVVLMSTRSSRVRSMYGHRTDTRRDFLPKELSSQPLLQLAFFRTRSELSQKSLGGVEESVGIIVLCMRMR